METNSEPLPSIWHNWRVNEGFAKLTNKQSRFVEEYLIDLNATQAAIRAGYSEKTAKSIGQENLTKPDIQECIQKQLDQRSERTEITADRVLQALAEIAYDTEKEQTRDRIRALELLGKHQVLFSDKLIHVDETPALTSEQLIARLKELDEELASIML